MANVMSEDKNASVDRRATSILFDTYWSSGCWRDAKSRHTSSEDFEYAKQAGVMFDPIRLTHDEVVRRAIAAASQVQLENVANAFIVSLATRRLELRSALGSFAVLQHFSMHAEVPRREGCDICGQYEHKDVEDLNVLNFERLKWGGVRHHQPLYGSMDLELFQKLGRFAPTPEDVVIFRNILNVIEGVPAKTSSAVLEKYLAKSFKSTKNERGVFIGILGYCGILATAEHPGFIRQFVPWANRELPARRFVDMAYPACWWQRSDGINEEALAFWFGHVL